MLAAESIPDLSGLFAHFGAEMVLCIAAPLIVVADLVAGRARRNVVAGSLGLLALVVAFLVGALQPARDGTAVAVLLRADGVAKAFRLLALGTGVLAGVAALRARDVTRGHTEFFLCLIGAVVGACFTAASNNLVMLYLSIETLSLCGYLLAGFKKHDAQGSEAAMKYVIFGAVSSGAMLYGFTLLYGFAGSALLATPAGSGLGSIQAAAASAAGSPAFLVAVVLVLAGIAYKIAAAPFQFWCPDVYQGSPTSVAAFLAVASKGAGFAALLRVVAAVSGGAGFGLTDALVASNDSLRVILLVVALVTMTVGNLAALRQQNSKRLLAYSAIAHAGYLLLGVAVISTAGATAVVFYLFIYLFMTLGAFLMVALVERETGRTDIDAFEGLGYVAPTLAVCMSICLFGLIGLPPTGGFVGKFFIFREVFAFAGAHDSSLFFWGGVIGLLNGVVSLGYYARFLKVMFLCERDRIPTRGFAFAGLDKGLTVVLVIPVLVLGVAFAGLWDLASTFARGVF